jgi:hypothetical protein
MEPAGAVAQQVALVMVPLCVYHAISHAEPAQDLQILNVQNVHSASTSTSQKISA